MAAGTGAGLLNSSIGRSDANVPLYLRRAPARDLVSKTALA